MAKRNIYGPTALMMTLFLLLFPWLVSGFDKKAVVYASLSLCLIFLAYETMQKGYTVVSKSFLLTFSAGLYSLFGMFYVSDKGSQGCLTAFLFLCSGMCALSMLVKQSSGEDMYQKLGEEVIFKCGAVYSVAAILWQVFIDSKFLSSMNLGGGSNTATAVICFLGLISGLSLYRKGKRSISFFVFMALMLYCFLISRSIIVYFMTAVVIMVVALHMRHKKLEAFGALVAASVFGIIGLIYTITLFVTDAVGYKGAIRGLFSFFGIGSGGYEAIYAILGAEGAMSQNTFLFITESFGVFGIILTLLALWGAFVTLVRRKSFSSLAMGAVFVTMLLSSVQTFFVVLPILCIYYGASGQAVSIKLNKAVSFIASPVALLCALLFFARIPFALGQSAFDAGDYKKSGDYFSLSAKLSLFDSEGWERAYECASKEDAPVGAKEREYLENAVKFNGKNYGYKKLIASSYTKEGDFNSSLAVWEKIMEKYDDERLYEDYCYSVMDVMSTFPGGVRMEELYNRIDEYAKRATDKDVKFKVNNILAKSQAYYIESRENGGIKGDMYQESINMAEEVTEYASGSAES